MLMKYYLRYCYNTNHMNSYESTRDYNMLIVESMQREIYFAIQFFTAVYKVSLVIGL